MACETMEGWQTEDEVLGQWTLYVALVDWVLVQSWQREDEVLGHNMLL